VLTKSERHESFHQEEQDLQNRGRNMVTKYREQQIVEFLFTGTALVPEPTIYLLISSTQVQPDGTGITEPSLAAGYTRISLINDATTWEWDAIGKQIRNKIQLNMAGVLNSDVGTFTYWAISDSNSGGNILAYGNLTTVLELFEDNGITIEINDIENIYEDSIMSPWLSKSIAEHLSGITVFAPSSTYYFGVTEGAISEDGTITEPSDSGYARAFLARGAAFTYNATIEKIENVDTIQFNTAVDTPWGTPGSPLINFGVYDSPTGGNLVARKPVGNNSTLEVPVKGHISCSSGKFKFDLVEV